MKTENFLFLLLVAVIAIQLVTFNVNTSFTWDEAVYLSVAESLAQGKDYGYVGGRNVESFRPPLFPYALAGVYYLFGINIAIAQIFVSILFIASVAIFYKTARIFYSEKISLLATLFLATNHLVIFFSNRIFVEMLTLLLIITSFYFFLRMRKDKRFFIPLAAVLTLAILTRYNLFSVAIIYLIYVLVFERALLKKLLTSQYFVIGILVSLLIAYPFFDFILKSPDIILGSPQLKFEKFEFPVSYFLYFWVLPLFFTPFFIYGIYKFSKSRKKSLQDKFSIVFILLFLVINGLVLSSFRYLIPVLPFIALFTFTFFEKMQKKFLAIILIASFLNMVTGYAVTYLFINPVQGFEQLPTFIEIRSYFSEGLDRKNAALYIKDSTEENETVMTNAYAWLWLYTKRNWIPMGDTEEEFLSNIGKYNVRYIYSDGPLPDFAQNKTCIKKVLSGHADVYKIEN